MSSFCVNHPDDEAKTTCAECETPICAQCIETVDGRDLCAKCAEAASSATTAANTAAPNPSRSVAGKKSPLAGIVTAGIIAIATAIGAMELLVYSPLDWSWLFAPIGLVVGLSLRFMTGRGGEAMVKAAIGLMLLGIIVGHLVFVLTMMKVTGASTAMLIGDAAPAFLVRLGVFHWIWVLVGIVIAAVVTQIGGQGQVAKQSPA
jgi:hypothetical protein